MKTNNKWIMLILLTMFGGSIAMAQMDNLPNMSAEWMRTAARNAATDATDAVVYNPAGITKLSNGFHINIGNQSLFRNPSHSYDLGIGEGPKSYSQDGADPFIPNIYAAYKKNNWALFTGVYIAGGGGTLNYPTGSITTDLIGCLLYTSDAADERSSVDLGGRRIIKKKKKEVTHSNRLIIKKINKERTAN